MKKIFRKRIIVSVLAIGILFTTTSYRNDFFEIAKQIEIFTTLFKELNMNYVDETNPAELMDTAIKGMLNDLDPYTRFHNEQDVEAYKINNSGEYTGIGAAIRRKDGRLFITEPYKDYPADKAGLKAGDEIIKIGDVLVSDFKEDAGTLLKGAPNSKVDVTYLRQGKQYKTTLTRAGIDVDAVPFYELIDGEIGYVVLQKFNRKASAQTKEAIVKLKEQGAKKIILDLRGNPGGLLTEAVNIVGLFVPKNTLVVTTKSKVKKFNKTYYTKNDPLDTQIPLAVLINGRSASASEIVSGGLQDLDRAVVVGSRSFGKGLVQRPKQLTYGTQLKVTISRYYTPSGRCIQALDYWNRDKDGKAVKVDEKNYKEFKTKSGRSVFDGGGVDPDIKVANAKYSNITKALLSEQAIFNYATEFYYKNEVENLEGFTFTNTHYSDFKSFLKRTDFTYETNTEKLLKKALEASEKDELKISSDYNTLLANLNKEKIAALDTYQNEIKELLEDEIIKRYFYKDGLYNYHLLNNMTIKEAKAILNNPSLYEKTLK
ncbi:MAG: S41 family peptidase [Flavobacteriaceae bacterium]|nr:S41 family peptidase [Flavobacteriaceae bacterium]